MGRDPLFPTLDNFSQPDLHRLAGDGFAGHTSEVLGCIVVRIVWPHRLPVVSWRCALDSIDRLVQFLKEPRPVSFTERRWTTRSGPKFPKVEKKISGRQRLADVVVCEGLSADADDICPSFETPGCERNVRCHDDVATSNMFDNPIIGRVESPLDKLKV